MPDRSDIVSGRYINGFFRISEKQAIAVREKNRRTGMLCSQSTPMRLFWSQKIRRNRKAVRFYSLISLGASVKE